MDNQPVFFGSRGSMVSSWERTSLNPAMLEEMQKTYDTVSLSYQMAMNKFIPYMFICFSSYILKTTNVFQSIILWNFFRWIDWSYRVLRRIGNISDI